MLKELNRTYITLIPKIDNSNNVGHIGILIYVMHHTKLY